MYHAAAAKWRWRGARADGPRWLDHYGRHEAYLFAIADAMRHEYETVARAGFVLQLDCPDPSPGSDCGFGTWVGQAAVDPDLVWAKLASLADGARRASDQLR